MPPKTRKKPGPEPEVVATIIVTLRTEGAPIDPESVLERFREEVEEIDLWVGDDQHDEESPYSIEIKMAES